MPQPQALQFGQDDHADNAREEEGAKSQAFFADLAAQAAKPHYGPREKDFVKVLLIRAEEAKIYDPRKA